MTTGLHGAGSGRPFRLAFTAIMATSFCFLLRAFVIDDWGTAFGLTETQKGELLGVGLWPFALSIVPLSLVIDRIGFRAAFIFAALCHLGGLAVILSATGYWGLYFGTFAMAIGNGAVEAAANPLIATVHSDDKARQLNRLHAAWPGGMVLAGLIALAMGDVDWRIKVALMFAPVLCYTAMLWRCRLPVSERVAAAVPYRSMLAEAGWISALVIGALVALELTRLFGLSPTGALLLVAAITGAYAAYARAAGRPLYLVLLILMLPAAITELSTDSWITSLIEPEMHAIGLPGGILLIYTAAIMFAMRLVAGSIVRRIGPPGTLAIASAVTAVGIYSLGHASGIALLAAGTLYAVGKSMFWGTNLAFASEQFPRGGAVVINLMAGAGMLAAGIVGAALIGVIQDSATARTLNDRSPALAERYLASHDHRVLGTYQALDMKALETATPDDKAAIETIRNDARRIALGDMALLPIVMLCAYGVLTLHFRRRGGYRPIALTGSPAE